MATTALDDRLVPRALDTIDRYGKKVVFTVIGTATYDPATGAVTESGKKTYTKKVSPPGAYLDRYVDGDLIRRGDLRCIIAASGLEFTPVNGLQVDFDSKVFRVMSVKPIYSGEQVAVYELQLRG